MLKFRQRNQGDLMRKLAQRTRHMAMTATALALITVIMALFVPLWNPSALLGLDASGGRDELFLSEGEPPQWWGPFSGPADAPCRLGYLVWLDGGKVDAVQRADGVHLSASSPHTIQRRCFGAAALTPTTDGLSLTLTRAMLPFHGRLTLGQEITETNAIFGAAPKDVNAALDRTDTGLLGEGKAWTRFGGGSEKVIDLHPGDSVQFLGAGGEAQSYGALVIQDGRLRTVAWTRGRALTIRRWGQTRSASELLAPSAIDRLLTEPLWVLATLAATFAINGLAIWATHYSTLALFEQAEAHHEWNRQR